jgi:hypothetical protein
MRMPSVAVFPLLHAAVDNTIATDAMYAKMCLTIMQDLSGFNCFLDAALVAVATPRRRIWRGRAVVNNS